MFANTHHPSHVVRHLLLSALVLPLLLVASLAPVHAAPPPPPPTLAGEFFQSVQEVPVDCFSPSGTFTFSASGPAVGPYSGTFTETGSATFVNNQVTAFAATFTIQSPQGTVTGQKTFDPTQPYTPIGCAAGINIGYVKAVPTTYTATIVTPTGSAYHDQGTSYVGYLSSNGPSSYLGESFTSTLPQPVPLAPTSKEQCMNGGYMNFIDPSTGQPFTNQGQCIAYVNHHS